VADTKKSGALKVRWLIVGSGREVSETGSRKRRGEVKGSGSSKKGDRCTVPGPKGGKRRGQISVNPVDRGTISFW